MSNIKKQNMQFILKKIENLPSLPLVVNKIVVAVQSPKTSAQDLKTIIEKDPSITAKILKLVNSAYYGFPRAIKTISHAVVILGFNELRNLALSVSVFDMFKEKNKNPNFDRTAFWLHSIGVAVGAKLFAKKNNFQDIEEAFICGLLHDIGKIVLDQYMNETFVEICKTANEKDTLFYNVEDEYLEIKHDKIGEFIGEKWKLPSSIVNSIARHHNPPPYDNPDNPEPRLVDFVHAADVFIKMRKIGNSGDNKIPRLLQHVWKSLKITPDDLPKIYQELDVEVENAKQFLEIAKG